MTLKKRLFISNVLMMVIPMLIMGVGSSIFQAIIIKVFNIAEMNPGGGERGGEHFRELYADQFPLIAFLWGGLMVIMILAIFLNNRALMKKIVSHVDADHARYENNRRELIAGISHDLRTPLTSIKAYLEGLETGIADTAEKRERYFTTIKAKTAELEHIINQLFHFSKLDMGDYPMDIRIIDLEGTVVDMVSEMADDYERRGLKVTIEEKSNTSSPLLVNADYLQLRSVIVNVLENSLRYRTSSPGHAQITVCRAAASPEAVLTIADDGPGVAPEALRKIFDVFYRTDPARRNTSNGSGLGLAIADKSVRRMGGSIRAENVPGGGLAIVITLPVSGDS